MQDFFFLSLLNTLVFLGAKNIFEIQASLSPIFIHEIFEVLLSSNWYRFLWFGEAAGSAFTSRLNRTYSQAGAAQEINAQKHFIFPKAPSYMDA